jgi:hypothetical protein
VTTIKQYRCENPACSLGSRSDHGTFTGGITVAQRTMLTGEPPADGADPDTVFEGYCPNCGVKGKADGTFSTHKVAKGGDS